MAEDSEQAKQTEWVKIVSKRDGHSFIVPRDVAMGSGFLRNTFDPEAGFVEGTQNTCIVDERYEGLSPCHFNHNMSVGPSSSKK